MRRFAAIAAAVLLVSFPALGGRANAHEVESDAADPHAHHREMLAGQGRYERSVHAYATPDVSLIAMDGTRISLRQELAEDRPIVLSFIFTSCTTICPVLTATLARAQDYLMSSSAPPQLISISIDPEYDDPARLQKYAEVFHARGEWHFLTGDTADIVAVQKAFDAFRGSKLNHVPLTFLRAPAATDWVRLEGTASAAQLVDEYRRLLEE